nr:unnamed protein product [Spirometra erinaceieuropaei]
MPSNRVRTRKSAAPDASSDLKGTKYRLKDGELVLSGGEHSDDPIDRDDEEIKLAEIQDANQPHRNKRKQTFERRNIKRVREDALSEEAQSAQRAEMERRKRLQDKEQAPASNSSAITTSEGEAGSVTEEDFTAKVKSLSTDSLSVESSKTSVEFGLASDVAAPSNGLDAHSPSSPSSSSMCLQMQQCAENKPSPAVVPSASASLFKSYSRSRTDHKSTTREPKSTGDSQENAILLGDSDDEVEMTGPVIELSDSEDVDAGDDAEDEVQAEYCELRDAANLPDANGRISIGSSGTEPDAQPLFLSPHFTRIIKPHQVSGVRFLYDNLIESQSQFETTEGFGCILAHSMGLGKSVQIIAFLDVIFRYCNARSVLLIVPINTLQNWQTEFELWLPSALDELHEPQVPHLSQSAPSLVTLDPCANDFLTGIDVTATGSSEDDTFNSLLKISSSPPRQSDDCYPPVADEPSAKASLTPKPKFPPETDALGVEEQVTENNHVPPLQSTTMKVEEYSMTSSDSKTVATAKEMEEDGEAATSGEVVGEEDEQEKKVEIKADLDTLLHRIRPFKLHTIKDTTKSLEARYQVIHDWMQAGGVLLLGYEMFRLLTNPRKPPSAAVSSTSEDRSRGSRKKRKPITIDLDQEEKRSKMWFDMRAALVDPGPQIVICDEGHRIKNSEACISKALKAIRTRRRVVLTGYPLQNNLMEYWCMVDFVRPNYLGTRQEFTNMFQRPIENGQCVDSTAEDRKVMQGRAHVLHDLLSGFVQRRSHAVLKASLPPKTEVVLLVKMSPLQRRLYSTLMNLIGAGGAYNFTQANTLRTYALCCKIWNHPDILWRVVEENIEIMDFDLEDSTVSGSTSANCSGKPTILARSQSKRRSCSDSLPSPTQQTFPFPSFPPGSVPPFAGFNGAGAGGIGVFPSSLFPQYAALPAVQAAAVTAAAPTLPALSAPSSNDDKYAWATDPELWGRDFKPGCVENGGKVLLFLSLLEGSMKCGDKMLVFSQSLLTLDLIERVLGKLPLPKNLLQAQEAAEAAARLQEDSTKAEAATTAAASGDANPEAHSAVTESTNGETVAQSQPVDTDPLAEETSRSIHYRWSRRLRSGLVEKPKVWTRNAHYLRLDGSTSPSERERLINLFNDPTSAAKLFLVSTRAGSLGVNLVGANRVVVFDASWNPCHDCQAVCRVYRYGQVKPCYIYRLVSDNTMERKIYDRQVTKQGVSDRVVDELNPGQQFTRSQVEVLISYEDKEMPSITDDDIKSIGELVDSDDVLRSTLESHKAWITTKPFTHESLLIDRKDYRLTRVEKKIARQRYEQEKMMSFSFQHAQQLQQLRILQQQAALYASGLHQTMRSYSGGHVPSILSKSASSFSLNDSYKAMLAASNEAACQAERISRIRMLQKELDDARARSAAKELGLTTSNGAFGADCKITRVVATSDLVFPSTNAPQGSAERKIPKGEIVEIIQTSRGKYLRLPRTGDLYAVKAGQPAPDESSTDTPVATSESGPNSQAAVTMGTPTSPSVSMNRTTVEPNQDTSFSSVESSVGTGSQFPCQTEAAQTGSQVSHPTSASATTKSLASSAPATVFPLAKSDSVAGDPLQEVRKTLPAADWAAPLAESKTNMPVFPAMTGQFFGHELLGAKSSPDPADSRLHVNDQSRFPQKTTANATFLPKAVGGSVVSNLTSKEQADALTTTAAQPFPLCPRCRHPPPCICSSLTSAWERTNSATNSFLSNSAFADSRGSSFGETRNCEAQVAVTQNPVFSQAQPITTVPTATAISSPSSSSSSSVSRSFASQGSGYPQFPEGLKYDPTGAVFNQAIYAAAARGASSSAAAATAAAAAAAAAATFPSMGQQFTDFGGSTNRMFGTPASSSGYAGQQQQPQVAAAEGCLMKPSELARTASYHSSPSTAVGHFMAGMQAAVDDSYRHQQQRYSNEYAAQQQQSLGASQSGIQAHTQQANVPGYMSTQSPTLPLPDMFPPKCQTNSDYQFGNRCL